MVIISKVLVWKVLDISYIKSSFSTITRHIDNGFWETPYSEDFADMDQHMCKLFLG